MLKNVKGFTLIELMIVVSIIGILAAIIFPKFGGGSFDHASYNELRVEAERLVLTANPGTVKVADATGKTEGETNEFYVVIGNKDFDSFKNIRTVEVDCGMWSGSCQLD